MKKQFAKLPKRERQKIELEYHQMNPRDFDRRMSRAKRHSPGAIRLSPKLVQSLKRFAKSEGEPAYETMVRRWFVEVATKVHPGNLYSYGLLGFFGAVVLILISSMLYLPAFFSVEIRQRGMVGQGRLVPWKDIVSYVWEPPPSKKAREKCEYLSIRLQGSSGLGSLRPTLRLSVLRTDRPAIDSILQQQLMEWPT